MAYFTRSRALNYSATYPTKSSENLLRKSVDFSKGVAIFLSHSHQDLENGVLNAIKRMLGDIYVDVYIDSIDPTMPSVTNAITAETIRNRIDSSNKFILVATINSLSSRWVPWELGYADRKTNNNKIAVLPIVDSLSDSWPRNEYIGLYNRIEDDSSNYGEVYFTSTPSPVIIRPDGSRLSLRDWLNT